ncbi:MAG TPA: arginine--tRNA ligase [Candidatus Azoamicus sp. MARI]
MIDFLKSLCFKAIIDEKTELRKQLSVDDLEVLECKNMEFGHFQFNGVIKLAKRLNIDAIDFSNNIKKNIEKYININDISVTITGNSFINFNLSSKFIIDNLKSYVKLYRFNMTYVDKIILDYSSPNIAKDMHIGHLRSTVVGDCLSKLLVFCGHKVIKISHLGDWGTQFGLLIAYLKDIYGESSFLKDITLSQLSNFYKLAQSRYISDIKFKNIAKNEVVLLQSKSKLSLNFWKNITNISKKEYKKIYLLLNVDIKYKGESFYSNLLKPLIDYLTFKKVISISDGAKCIYLNDLCKLNYSFSALMVQKSDGGYNYATTEIAALYYRINYYKPNKIIYITDVGQKLHFDMVFKLVNYLGFNKSNVELVHIPLGLMLNSDGKKIKTRSGSSEKLIDVLNESIEISKNIILKKKKMRLKELNYLSKILGINTIKYSDLSNKLDQNYIFDKNNAFKNTGNTASFLMYAYVRIYGIRRKNKRFRLNDVLNYSNIYITEKAEIDLALALIMYKYFLKLCVLRLNPNILTAYVYRLAEKFHIFFNECNIINSSNSYSRIFLCEISRKIFKSCFDILGLKTVDKM